MLVITVASMLVLPMAEAHGPTGCGATAPITPYCSTGWHEYDLRHDGAQIYANLYTGTVESTLRFPGGEWIYSCWIIGGVKQRCDQLGKEPPPGTWVYHTCDSYYFPGLYGGVGEYDCMLK